MTAPNSRYPKLPTPSGLVRFDTAPPFESGAEILRTQTIFLGQRDTTDEPKAAMMFGKLCEFSRARSKFGWSVWLDSTFPHVMLISGRRGSGKSWDLGILAENFCSTDPRVAHGTEQFAMIMFDTQNQFWTLGQGSEQLSSEEQTNARAWGLHDVPTEAPTVFRPRGTPVMADFEIEFAIRPSDLVPDDWTNLCNLDRFDAMGQCLRNALKRVGETFSIPDLLESVLSESDERFAEQTRNAVAWRLEAIAETNLFDPEAEDISARLASSGNTSVVELAELDDDTKAVVVAVILRRVIHQAGAHARQQRLGSHATGARDATLAQRIWVLIDEAHLVCPNSKTTAATEVVRDYVKRGRDAGLSLVVASQQPSSLDTQIVSQCDISITHNLTIKQDIDAATNRMPAPPPATAAKNPSNERVVNVHDFVRKLEAGQSLIADAATSRAVFVQSRPRITPHGGGEPALD